MFIRYGNNKNIRVCTIPMKIFTTMGIAHLFVLKIRINIIIVFYALNTLSTLSLF